MPIIRKPSALQIKCSPQVCDRGLNNGTVSLVSGSIAVMKLPILYLQNSKSYLIPTNLAFPLPHPPSIQSIDVTLIRIPNAIEVQAETKTSETDRPD
jgi:hypothetical protein